MNKLTKLEVNTNGRFYRPNPTEKQEPSIVEQVVVPASQPPFNLSTALSMSNAPLPLFAKNKLSKATPCEVQLASIL